MNAFLKHSWKLLSALPRDCFVMAALDATLLTQAGSYLPVTVVLTPQFLFIVGEQQDAHQHALSLTDLTWRAHSNDPTLVILDKLPPPAKLLNPDQEPISGCPERVADYVRSTCSEGIDAVVTDIDSSDEADNWDENSLHHPQTRVKIYLSPRFRSVLISSITIASKALKGQGFTVSSNSS